jgi:hypothetical protein
MTESVTRRALGAGDVIRLKAYLPLPSYWIRLLRNVVAPELETQIHIFLGYSASLEISLQCDAASKGDFVRMCKSRVGVRAERDCAKPVKRTVEDETPLHLRKS